MQQYEAKITAMSVAFNLAVDDIAPPKSLMSSAMAYMCGKISEEAFTKKCGKFPVYSNAVRYALHTQSEFGLEKLCAAHEFIYDGKEGCGDIRSGELSYPGGSCTDPKMLRGSLKEVLAKMQALEGAPKESKADFAARLCCYVRELIILSPFAYGNGVVRRAFIQSFCRQKGFVLNYALAGKKAIEEAERAAFMLDETGQLFTVLVKCLSYASILEPSSNSSEKSLTNANNNQFDKTPQIQKQNKIKQVKSSSRDKGENDREQTEMILKMQRQMDEMRAQIADLKSKLGEKNNATIDHDSGDKATEE